MAKDFLVENDDHASEVQKCLRMHLRKRWSKDEVIYFKGTRYTNRKKSQTNLTDYNSSDECHGELCFHLEFRLQKNQAVKRAGVTSVSELIKFDPEGFWKPKFTLFSYNDRLIRRLVRIMNKINKESKVDIKIICRDGEPFLEYNKTSRNKNAFIRTVTYQLTSDEDGRPRKMQEVLHYIAQCDGERKKYLHDIGEDAKNIYGNDKSKYITELDSTVFCYKNT